MSVAIVDAAGPGGGVSAAGMGHLVALDESAAELDLCLLSLRLWNAFLDEHPAVGEPHRCGTLWVAEDEHQLEEAEARARRLNGRGWRADLVSGDALPVLEPALRRGLAGAVRVAGDSVVYPPAVAAALVKQACARGAVARFGQRVVALGADHVVLADGTCMPAGRIVVAAGVQVAQLLPEVPVFARKGHLAITDRYPGTLRHQVVSMGYGQPEGGTGALAVAANVQPRATGQWLVGSCRQDGQVSTEPDPAVTAAVLRAAMALLPPLAAMRIIRTWAGMRPASPDGLPIIGRHPARGHVWLAAGHEGLGVTTAFGTARLLADLMLGRPAPIDPSPYLPGRLLSAGAPSAAAGDVTKEIA